MNKEHLQEEELWEYIDGELPPIRKTEVEKHLNRCPFCKKEYKQLTAFDIDVAGVVHQQPSMRFTKNVMELIEIELSGLEYRPLLHTFWRRLIASGFVMAIMALLVVASFFPGSQDVIIIQQFLEMNSNVWQSPVIVVLIASLVAFWGVFFMDKLYFSKKLKA